MTSSLSLKLEELKGYFDQNQFDAYFHLVNQVLDELKKSQQLERYITCATDKAVAYFKVQNLMLASQVLSEITSLIEEQATTHQKIRYYNTMAAIQGEIKNYEQTLQYLSMAQRLAEKEDDKERLVPIYHNLAMYYYDKENNEKSLFYIQKCNDYHAAVQGKGANAFLFQLSYAQVLLKLKCIDEAKQIIEGIKPLIEETDLNYNWVTLRMTEAYLLQEQGSMIEAYKLMKQSLVEFQAELSWCEEIYELLCILSKQCNEKKVYLQDLKAYFEVKKLVTEQKKKEQLDAILYYFDDQALKEISWTDPLTKVKNRRYIEENYPKYEGAFAAFLFDIDHFKSINDQYGHLAGDRALQIIATMADDFVERRGGQFVRLGGDEFFGIFPVQKIVDFNMDLTQFLVEVRSVRIPVEQHNIRIRISIGASHFTQFTALDEVLSKTDQALYQSKNNGRDQLTILS